MADLRIVDAPEIPTENITGEEKLPTGGNGNYSISLDSLADYTKTKKDLVDTTTVDGKVNGVRQELDAHIEDLLNPHQVTKGQIGLGNVDNTADADKPVSNSTQSAIISAVAPKADKTYVDNQLTLKSNKADVYTKSETFTKQESNDLVNNSISTALTPINSSLDLAKRGIANRYDSSLTYNSGERVVLTNGDIAKSAIDGNTNDPNVNMTGWEIATRDKGVLTWSGRTQDQKNKENVSLLDLGFVADGVTDNLAAWNNLITSGIKRVTVPVGVYAFYGSIDKPSYLAIEGDVSPILSFGTEGDFKGFVAGDKSKIRGSVFLFKQPTDMSKLKSVSYTDRNDQYSSFTYCFREYYSSTVGSSNITGLAIVQDVDLYRTDGSVITPFDVDYKIASAYEVGHLIDDTAKGKYEKLTTFGYFSKAGTVIKSSLGSDDPDYNTFINCSTLGKHGLAIVGANNAPANYGLSSSRFNQCGIYTLDHAQRASFTNEQLIDYYANADTWRCIYIDGDVNATTAEINGHYFNQCEIRSRVDHPLELDHASNVHFNQTVFEQSYYSIPNSMPNPKFIFSANTKKSITFIGCRINYQSLIFNANCAGSSGAPILINGDPTAAISVVRKNPDSTWSVIQIGNDRGTGDMGLQITGDASSGSSGWRLQRTLSSNALSFLLDGVTKFALLPTGVCSVNSPASNDTQVNLSANGGSEFWSMRTQYSVNQLQWRYGGSGATVALGVSGGGTLSSGYSNATVGTVSLPYAAVYATSYMHSATVGSYVGVGSPEGVKVAGVGSTYHRTDGGAGTSFYVKESGAGNTGWVAK